MSVTHTVQTGDTLLRIARQYAVNPQSILAQNPELREDVYLVPGQSLHIPVRSTQVYLVQPQDTLFEIARRFAIPLHELLAANRGVEHRRLKPGQSLILPDRQERIIPDVSAEYGHQELTSDLTQLKRQYPFLHLESVGKSVMGKELWAVRIGTGSKEIHYNGAMHANEWITAPLLVRFIKDYAAAYRSGCTLRGIHAKELYQQTTLWLIPMVNPDGVELVQAGATPQHPFFQLLLPWNYDSFRFDRWKANIRGVDLNDQFPAHWMEEAERRGRSGPCPRDYGGTAPLTEPESIALVQFTRKHGFRVVIAFHSQGQEIYWNYRDLEPGVAEQAAHRLARESGYRAVKLSGSDAGYKDWFIQEFGQMGFTVEVGIGSNPLPLSQFDNIYQDVLGVMLEGLRLFSAEGLG